MSLTTNDVQKLYLAYFGRPADPSGLTFWTSGNATLQQVSNAFSASTEYLSTFAGLNNDAIVNAIYQNSFGHAPDIGGLRFWSDAISKGTLSVGDAARQIVNNTGVSDTAIVTAKVTAAAAFTTQVGSTVADTLGYVGTTAVAAAKAWLLTVVDTTTATAAIVPATLAASVASVAVGSSAGQTFTLTTGVDTFTGTSGNDTFNGLLSTAATTLTAFDNINGGAGTDTLNIVSDGAIDTTVLGLTIANVEVANFSAITTAKVDSSTWTGLTALNIKASTGADTITAAATTAVTLTDSGQAAGAIAINGGSSVTVTSTGASGGTITVGAATAATGAVSVTRSESATGATHTAGAINVTGGTTVAITQNLLGTAQTATITAGAVTVIGTANTTSVSATATPIATAVAGVTGVVNSTVIITDVNSGSTTKAGTITSVTASGYTTLNVNDNALTTLSVANGSGNIIIDNSGLTTATNKTLGLTVNGLTGGTLDDADIYTTLNVTTTGANSTLANITEGALTALTVAGSKVLTLTSTAGMAALATATVTGAAGLTADVSGLATVTAVDTSGATGTSTITLNGTKATFTGGAGVDKVTLATGATKAISLGAGNDSLTLGAFVPTAAISGGDGTDTLSMTAAAAATASGSATFAGLVTGFEKLTLTGATNQTIDLAVLGNYNDVTTSGGNGLTLSNLNSGGTLTLTGAGTAYTIGNSAFTAGANDIVNLALTDGTGAALAFGSVTAANVETVNITTADTQATPTNPLDTLTLVATSAKSVNVSGNAGLNLTDTGTALTLVDASGITAGAFTFTSGVLAVASAIKGSATGTNTVDFSAATGGVVTYTGGTGNDVITGSNGKNDIASLGNGTNSYTATTGNHTVTGGTGADTVSLGAGNNIVSLGNGTNAFTATSGNNTYTGGTGVDAVTVGGGSNTITTGTGADVITITAAGTNVNTYTTITDAHAGDNIGFVAKGAEVFNGTKVVLGNTAVFQDYANAVINATGDSSTNGHLGWFQFNGDTYVVESQTTAHSSFTNGVDFVVKLTGAVDLSAATVAANHLVLA